LSGQKRLGGGLHLLKRLHSGQRCKLALCDLVEEKMKEFADALPGPVECYTDYLSIEPHGSVWSGAPLREACLILGQRHINRFPV